ncbi:MAG: helix-turn-helix domain-containing protein [Pirellula sp.]|jgi:plasmid maintenance system antidote protein VapI|nr:helix-turn-helix domain-containing protein [Pirellula sp.]
MKKSKKKIDMTLADQLREAMAASGLTNYRISKEADIDQAVLSRFVSGERNITLEVADRICKLLDLEFRKREE